jgi:hypothetical protein
MNARRPRRRGRFGRRAVSEDVATILLLGMTITLFASIFVFTTRNPTAQPQPLNEFTAGLSYGGAGGLQVLTVSVTHLAGKVISGPSVHQAAIYIISQKHPAAIPSPQTLSAGLAGSTLWGFGQTWTVNISADSITSPDNLTVYVISNDQVQYQTTLFALVQTAAPYFLQVHITPQSVAPGAAFNLSAYAEFGSVAGNNVKVNLTLMSGSSGQAMTGSGASGLYYYDGTAPSPGSATNYYLFLTATDANGLKTMFALPLVVT